LVNARGNPFLEPLESDNFDVSFEWYKSDDTAFSAAVYYKTLKTGRENQPLETSLITIYGTCKYPGIFNTYWKHHRLLGE